MSKIKRLRPYVLVLEKATPIIIALFVGRRILKMNLFLLLGDITGAHNITAALNMLTEESESSIPVLSYAVAYAFANILLTIWVSVIVHVA